MNSRLVISGCCGVVCLAALCGVFAQRRQLADLRAQQQQALAALARPAGSPAIPAAANPTAAGSENSAAAVPAPSSELLRLRGQVARLTQRLRELAEVRAENEQLQAQAAARATNGSAANYLFKFRARMVGCSRPEDTLQSFLWALEHHDLTNLLQVLTADSAQEFAAQARRFPWWPENFFENSPVVVGLRIVSQETLPDGAVELHAETDSGARPTTFHLEQTNGQWKLLWSL